MSSAFLGEHEAGRLHSAVAANLKGLGHGG